MDEELTCEECGCVGDGSEDSEVQTETGAWLAGGKNAFCLEWSFHRGYQVTLCFDCLCNQYKICDFCGVLVDGDHYGEGYLPDDYDGEHICPKCYRSKSKAVHRKLCRKVKKGRRK